MGIIKQGILGPVSGKVGTVIGSSWNGIHYIKGIPATVANPQTPAQLAQRQKFAVVSSFQQPLTSFLNIGFKNYAIQMTGCNAAMAYNLRNSVTGAYPAFAIDYENALVARGNLPPAMNQVAASTVAATINFTWADNTGEIGAAADDKTLLLVYNPVRHQMVSANQLADRSALTQTVTVPVSFSGDLVHCYFAFISADGNTVSNSRYAGEVTVV